MKKILLALSFALVILLPGCRPSGPSTCTFQNLTPGITYRVHYTFPSPPVPITEVRVANSMGSITVPSHGFVCGYLTVFAVLNSNLTLAASPSSVYLLSPPATVTITGQSFDTTYGMPQVEYFDSNGYLVGSAYATSVSSNGTSLQADMPDLSNVYSGTYQVKVTNKTSQGYYAHIVGSATFTASGRDRTDSDGDGWYDDEDCDPYDPYRNTDCNGNCGGGGLGHPYEVPTICEY